MSDLITPHDPSLKRCPMCGETKPATAEHFHRDRYEPCGLTICCKVCRNGGPNCDVPLPDGYKVCSKCSEMKPETREYFASDKTCRNDLRSYCKECEARQRAPKKEQIAEYQRQWRAKNKGKIKSDQRIYQAKNKERISEQKRRYSAENRERKNELHRQWRANNRERSRAHARASELRRKARRLAAKGNHTAADIQRQYKAQKGKCYYCACKVGKDYHVDHVIPLSRGGSNGPENLVIACPTCNTSKQDKLPHEWVGSNRLL